MFGEGSVIRRPEAVGQPAAPGRGLARPTGDSSAAPSVGAAVPDWQRRGIVERRPLAPTDRVFRLMGYGLALMPAVGAAVPFAIGTGTQSTIVAALAGSIALVGLWGAWLVWTRRVILVQSPVNAPAAVFAVLWVLACVASNVFLDPRIAAQLGTAFTVVQIAAVAVMVVSLGLMVLGANVGQDVRYARLATQLLLAIGVVAITAYFAGVESWLAFLNTNGLFTLWAVALAYGQALFNQRLNVPSRLGLLALVAAFMLKVAVYQTGWLSGWAPALAAIGIITLLRSWVLAGAGVVLSLPVGLAFFDQIFAAVVESQFDEGSDSRLDIWLQAWDLLSQYPLLGTGPAGYAAYYMTLYVGSGSSMSTHSNYIDVAAQTGIAGAVTFLWLLGALGLVAVRACRRWRTGFNGGFVAAATGGLVGAIVAMALGDWVIPFVYNQGIAGFRYTLHTWVFLGFLCAFAAMPKKPGAEEQ